MTTPDPAPYDGPERRQRIHLTDEQVEEIAQRAAEHAIQRMTEDAYKAIGKGVVSKALWILGVCTMALLAWMVKIGYIKP